MKELPQAALFLSFDMTIGLGYAGVVLECGRRQRLAPQAVPTGYPRMTRWVGWIAVFQNGRRMRHRLYVIRIRKSMIENDDLELNRLIDELEKDSEEIDKINSELENHFEWLDILTGLNEISKKFVSNMDSLSSIHKSISDTIDNSFLIGTLWSGVISSYEGFVHDFFDLLLSNRIHAQEAIDKTPSLDKGLSDQIRLNKNKSISVEYLRFLFRKATLNNPNNGATLANHLFKTNIPEIDDKEMLCALEIRNAYTHNNGGIAVSLPSLELFHDKIDTAVSSYIKEIQNQANSHISKD